MYQKYINPWNSEDHPNVINIYVSATPWNLMTDTNRFPQHSFGFNSETKKYDFFTENIKGRTLKNPTKVFDIRWAQGSTKDFQKGKEVRLMVRTCI